MAETNTAQATVPEETLAALHAKVDALAAQMAQMQEQMAFLAEEAQALRERRRSLEDLQEDMAPVVRDLTDLLVDELQDLDSFVQLEDLIFLLRRLARNVHTFHWLLDQLESLADLSEDLGPITRDALDQSAQVLAQLEAKGYPGFLRQGLYVLDQIVTSFSEEDVRQLGDNIVLILSTIRAMTQPEILNLVARLTAAFEEVEEVAPELPTGVLDLIRQMRDPDVRRGLAVTLAILKRISHQEMAARQATQQALGADGHGG